MHAASVYPEPGSNSPKRCAVLRSRLLSEGLTTRTSLSRISCHSSVVKVQRPRHDSPRRRPRMMGLGARGVKPHDRVRAGRPVDASSGGGTAANATGRRRLSNGPPAADRAQIGLVSTSRMKAAPLSQHSSASSAEPVAAERADQDDVEDEAEDQRAMPALASRSRISLTRLLTGRSDRSPALERPDQGHLVGVLEVAADRQAAGDPADDADHRLEPLGEVHRRRLALEGRVGGQDHLVERRRRRARPRRRARAARGSSAGPARSRRSARSRRGGRGRGP